MKNLFVFTVSILFLTSCGKSKDLIRKNENLSEQLRTAQSQLDQTIKEKQYSTDQIRNLETQNTVLESQLEDCEAKMQIISSSHSAYMAKIGKMKEELKAAFPNNLGEKNFAIVEEDGRLIVRLPNKILYKSFSAEFNEEALTIIQKLSKIFRSNQGLQILVEGHTDDLPLKPNKLYKDNWDLSLDRAINVTRQLEAYGVHPQRLTAAGRAYFAPLDRIVSEEARAKNRRTEIIIRPNISELLKVIIEAEL